ncbi:MAG: hypothetical protein ACLU4N_14880 [Butyricimonas faecihominis]
MMAITEENIRGKIGNSIFYRVGSVTRVRSVAARYADANTSKQRESRSRLRVAIRFYRRLAETELRKVWYLATKGTGKSGYNLFLKLNMMILSLTGRLGILPGCTDGRSVTKENHLVVRVDEGMVSVAWEREEDLPSAGKEDKFMVAVLYADRSFSPEFVKTSGETRGDGKATFRLQRKRGTAAHLYCFFREKDGKAYSPSQHVRI